MDMETVQFAISRMKKMPNNAAASAAAAAASAAEARELVDTVDAATVDETVAYMDIPGDATDASVVYITGTDPVINAARNTMYICETLQTLTLTPSPNGITAVRFASGATATALNIPATVKWPEWFDGACEANRVYEISISDGVYGMITSWAS
jgi:hypothetical protein